MPDSLSNEAYAGFANSDENGIARRRIGIDETDFGRVGMRVRGDLDEPPALAAIETETRTLLAELRRVSGTGQALLDAAPEQDILVNNLGIFEPKAFAQITDADWLRFFEVNVLSGVRMARHHLARMQERGWGRVVFISSESGICPPGDMVHYGMSKSAQLSVSRGLAETCAGTGVTVNSVLPGPTRTEGAVDFFTTLARNAGQTLEEAEEDFFKYARPTSLLQRFIEPGEVAAMVAYVCSPRAAATNGAALRVEGGVVRSLI